MSRCLQEITNSYPPVDIPKAPYLPHFADFKVPGAGPHNIQQSHSVSKVPEVNVNGEKENTQKYKAQTAEEQLAQLDTSSTAIENKVGMDIFEEIQEIKRVNANTMIQFESLMQKANRDIRLLQLKVEDLEVEAMDMQEQLDLADHHIKTHKRLIRRFVGPEDLDFQKEYECDSTDEPSHEQNALPKPDNSSI